MYKVKLTDLENMKKYNIIVEAEEESEAIAKATENLCKRDNKFLETAFVAETEIIEDFVKLETIN